MIKYKTECLILTNKVNIEDYFSRIEKMAYDEEMVKKIVAIGKCGLDFDLSGAGSTQYK